MNLLQFVSLVEKFAGKSGVKSNSIPKELVIDLLHSKLADFVDRAELRENFVIIETEANVSKYSIPSTGIPVDVLRIQKVKIDTRLARKISKSDLEALQNET